ncbi:YadA-like family protein [Gallibacterium anatis]|uniref:YadA-like family protein n=1 Tax=Gallibacterium anatis TaxID=750 RepID=UPI003006ABE3
MLERQDDGPQIGAPIAVRSDFAGGDSTVGVVSVGSTYEQQFNSLQDIKDYHTKVGSLITVPVDVTVQVTKNGVSLGEQQQTRYFAADSTREEIYADSTLKEADKEKVWNTIQSKTSMPNTTYTVFETRRIQNVAPGLIGLNSTDAINGSQLFATNQMLGNLVGSLKKTFGDNVTITEDGQIKVSGGTLGWIAKAKAADGSNGTVNYQVGKDDKIAEDDLEKKGSAIEAADQLVFQAGKNIGLVQTPDTLTISTIDTPSFKSVELRGDEKTVDGKKVTEVTKIDSNGMKVVTETSTPASDGSTTPTVTEKVSTTVGKDGVSTDGSVKVTNGKDGEDLVTIGKNVDPNAPEGTDGENGTIGLDGKNGSSATITVDRGTSSLDNTKNIGGTNPEQDIGENNPAKMDRITYTTKNKDGKEVITHEVATMDDGLFFSGDSADGKNGNVKNTFGRKLSEEAKIVGGVTAPANLTDNNIGVVSNGSDTLTIKLAKRLTGLDSATYTSPTTKTDDGDDATSTMKVDGNGIRFVGDNNAVKTDAPSLTTDGITGGNKTITNVASGIGGEVKDSSHNNANTFLENVNKIGKKDGDQPAADAISENVVVNAKDLKNLVDTGFKLNTSGQGNAGATTVKIGDTINVVNGVNTKVSAIDDTVNGTHTFHIDVTGMPISYTDTDGNALTKIGDKYYKNTDIENGKPKTNATEVPADKVTNNIKVINKDGTTNNQGTISNVKSVFDSNIGNGADTGSKVDEIKDGSVISNTGSNLFINDLTKLNDQVDPKATDTEAEKIRAKKDEEKLNSVSTVRDLQKVALTPLFFEGDTAESATTKNAFGRKLSEKAKILGGQKDVTKLTDNNIGVVSNGSDTLTIKLAKELQDLDSVKVSNGKDGDDAKDLVTIGKEVNSDAAPGTDGENGTIGLNGKNGSEAVITIDRGTKSMNDKVNLGTDPSQDISGTNTAANMDRITYTTKGPNNSTINHEVATLDDGFFLTTSKDVANKKAAAGVKLNDTIQFNDGTNTKVSTVTSEKGVHELHIDVSGLPVSYTDTDGDAVTKIGDKYYKSNQVVDGKPIDGATEVPADQVTNNIKVVNTDGTTNTPGTISNVASGIGGEVKDPAHNNENTFIENINKVGKKNDDGTVAPDAISENVVVNAKDLKNLVDTGFKLNTSGQPTKTGASTVKIGDTINIIDGANTKVSAIDDSTTGTHTFHIDVNGLPMSYVDSDGNPLTKIGDKFYKTSDLVNGVPPAGTAEVPANKVTSNVSMLDNTGSHTGVAPQIKNVGSGLVDNNGKTIKPNELLNMTDANNPVLKNAVNVGDLKQVAAAAKTEVTGTGEAFVTDTEEDGHIIYNVHVDKILSHKDADGNKLVRGGDGKYYTNEAIKDKTYIPSENKWYSNSDLTDGKPNKDAQAVTPNPVDQSNVKTSLVNPNTGVGTGTDTSMTLDNVKSGIGGDAGNGIKDGTTVDGTQGNNTFIKNLDKVGGTGKGAIDKTTVVNAGDLKNLADTPLFFSGDAADGKEYNGATNTKNTFGRKLSEEAKIVGGVTTPANLTDNNIGVVSNGSDTLTIKLAKQLTGLDSATYTSPTTKTDDGDATSTMKVDGNGIRFVGDNNVVKTDAPSLTTDGITGGNKQITNVGSGLKDGDTTISISDLDDSEKWPNTSPIWNNAVNVGDLKKAKDAATTEVTGTGKAIVTKTVGNKGQNIYNVHVDPVVDVVATNGKTPVVRGDDGKYYNPTDIADKTFVSDGKGGGSWYNKSDIAPNGKPNTDAPVQNISPVDVKNNFVNPNGTGSIVLDNVKSGIGGEVDDPDSNHENTFMKNVNTIGDTNGISENTVVNAGDLKNLVDTGFKLNTSGHSGDAQTVKIGETIKVVDGANTKVSDITSKDGIHELHVDVTGLPMTYTVSQTGGTDAPVSVSKVGDTYQLADGTKLVKVGDKFYKPSQLVNPKADQPEVKPDEVAKDWSVNDSVSLVNKDGSTNAPTLKNVGSGLKDANGNSTTLDQAVGSNAVNVDDLRTMGKAATTEVTGTGAAEVTKVTGANGQNIYNVHVDKLMTVKPVDSATKVARGGDGKYYDADDIKDKTFVPSENKWYNTADVDATTGKPLEGKSALAKQPIALDQSKLKNSVVNPNGDGATIVDNVKSGIGGEVKDTSGKNTFIENLDKVGKPANEGGIDKTTVVNAGDLKNLADTPLFFSGDAADDKEYNGVKNTKNTFGRKLSEEAKIVGGQTDITKLTDNNIGVVSNGTDTLTIKLAKELQNLTSVTTGSGDNTTVMNQDGVTITTQTPQNGDKPASTTETKLSKDGLATDGTIKVTGDNAKDLVTIGKGTETDQNATDKEFGTVTIDGKNGSNATLTVDRGTSSLDDTKNIGTDPNQDISENNPAKMDRITYTTKNKDGKDVTHEVATLDDGFFLTTSTDVAKGKAAAGVKLNHTIKFTDGANTKVSTVDSKDGIHELHVDVTGLPMTYTVSQTGGTDAPVSVSKVGDTYQLADGTKLVKVGDKFYKPSQLVNPKADQPEVKPDEVAKDWSVNDSVSLVNKDGSTNAPTLKNVGSGLKDANGNSTTLDQAVGSNAVNVDDLRTMGKAATTEVTGTGAAEVTKVTGANGQNIYNVHVERFMQVAETDVEGNKVVKAADNHYYKEADIKDKTYIDGQWYNNTDIKDKTKIGDKWYNADDVVNGVPEPNATELTVQATTAPNKAVGLQNNLVNPNDNKPTRLSNLASALSGEVGNGANPADNSAINGIDKNGKPTSESGSNTFVKNVLDLDATEKTVEQLKTSLGHEPSEDEVKAEKARAEKDKALLNSAVTVADLQKTLQSPLFFEGDSADGVANENGSDKNTFARKLSQKTKIVGGVDLGLKENATAEERKKAIAEKLTDHNIGVISNGTDTLTIKLAKDLTDLHSVTTTDDKGNTTQINGKGLATTTDDGKGNIKITTVTSDGITIVTTDKDGNNSVSLTNKGLDNGHHQIINVKSGLLDRQGKPVTLKEASGDILNNAVNVKDLRDVVQGLTDSGKGGGFGLTGNNGEVSKSLGETITLKGGIANKVENGRDMNKPEKATTDKNTYIDVKTSKNGSEKIMVVEIAKDLTDLNSAEFTDQEGNTTKMKGDGIYIDKNGDGNADISLTSEGLNNGGNKITNVADGTEDTDAVNVSQLNKLKQEIKQNIGDEINELNAYAPVVYSDKEGNRVIRKGNKFVKKNDETAEIPPQDIRLSLVNADGKTTTPSTLQNVAKGVNPTDAVNVEQLEEATEKPLTFNGDTGSSSAKLGETVAIKGGANSADLTDNNIGVIADSTTKTLNVKLSKKLKGLESAEFVDNNGNTTNITGDGVHISGGNGSNVSLTSQGLNNGGNRITNVAPGVEATDAVNVSQLNQVGAALHNRINNVAKGAYGGVASAGAMASLPQAYLPGKSMVAAGASHYRGESAVALGASRISDNGKIILKLNASHNTSGNTMVGAGVGYQF